MKALDRVILNTSAQYVKTIINVLLSMYSTRLVLSILGAQDYGIYTLVAGVVTMLSFLSSSLVVSTQRFLSYNIGKGDFNKLSSIFNDSVIIHILIGLLLSFILLILTPFVFGDMIVVPQDRVDTAKYVYLLVILMLFLTLVSSPFRAALISHEDIVYISILDVMDGVLKVLLALWLSVISFDKLTGYGYSMLVVQFFNFFALTIFAIRKYSECKGIRIKKISKSFVSELLPFVGWTVYSHACIIGRTQGIAVLLSRFVSIIANASFGIALQLLSFVSFISSSVLNALQPQIVKAEGAGNRSRLLDLSCLSSKVSFLLLAAIVIPVCFYINELLALWLDDVPEYASFFCSMVFVASLLDSTTIGLGIANQAIGNIKNFSILVNTTKILTLVPVWFSFRNGCPIYYLALFYCGFEFLCALIRLPILKITAGLSIMDFIRNVFLPLPLPIAVYSICLFVFRFYFNANMILSVFVGLMAYITALYYFSLKKSERLFAVDFIKRTVLRNG